MNLLINGRNAVKGQVDKTHAHTFSLDDSAGAESDKKTAVNSAYGVGSESVFWADSSRASLAHKSFDRA